MVRDPHHQVHVVLDHQDGHARQSRMRRITSPETRPRQARHAAGLVQDQDGGSSASARDLDQALEPVRQRLRLGLSEWASRGTRAGPSPAGGTAPPPRRPPGPNQHAEEAIPHPQVVAHHDVFEDREIAESWMFWNVRVTPSAAIEWGGRAFITRRRRAGPRRRPGGRRRSGS